MSAHSPARFSTIAHGVLRIGLAGLFLWTGVEKLGDPAAFAAAIANYRVLPDALAALAAVALPVLELVVGVALLVPSHARGAAILSAAMLVVFAAAMAQSKLRGIDLDCGCFGAAQSSQVSWSKVAMNVALAILSLWTARISFGSSARSATEPAP
jgi:uncharacterized membrane protein YphA (DoxX/SURF4 family)